MDLELTRDQAALRHNARRFVVEVLQPLEQELERAGGRLPPQVGADLRRQAIEAGLAGGELPVEAGGKGWTVFEQVLVHEQYGQVTGGLWSFVPKLTVRYIDPRSAAVYEALGALLVALGIWFSMQFRLQTQPTGMALAFATGVLGLLGALCFLVAVARGPVSLVTILSALYPALTVCLAVLFLGETITLRQGCGMVLALVSMVLIVG